MSNSIHPGRDSVFSNGIAFGITNGTARGNKGNEGGSGSIPKRDAGKPIAKDPASQPYGDEDRVLTISINSVEVTDE